MKPMKALDAIFSPQSIAVIGASRSETSIGRAIFENILLGGYTGTVYPVNPKAHSIQGVKAYPTIGDLPEEVDLGVIVVPAAVVPRVAEECGENGVKELVVVSAGFKEIGEEGAKLERELTSIIKKFSIRLIGPNCLGTINTDPEVRMNLFFASKMPAQGSIGFISQSGAVCTSILDYAKGENIGFSKFVSMGNKADVNEIDLMDYLRRDQLTKVILLYIEDIVDGRKFIETARETTSTKPVIAVKAGASTEGARAASSHTGALAGSDEAYDAILKQSGVVRVESIVDLFDYARAFDMQPLPKGNRVAIITNGGGPGIMATDACIRYGLRIAEFSPETTSELRAGLPTAASTKNPIDLIGDAEAERYGFTISKALEDQGVDCGLIMLSPQVMIDIKKVAERIVAVAPQYGKTIVACIMGLVDVSPAVDALEKNGIPHYSFPEAAVRALTTLYNYHLWLDRPRTEVRHFDVDTETCRRIIENAKRSGVANLAQHDAIRILEAYGIPVGRTVFAGTKKEALEAASEIGFPVAMKIVSSDVTHKVDVGGVRLSLFDGREVEEAYDSITNNIRSRIPSAHIDGVIVQEQVQGGAETIVGMRRDPKFGPLLMFGLGGIYVEVYHDLAFRLAPLRELSAHDMTHQIRGRRIFEGFRGQPPLDMKALEECILRISQLSVEMEDITELDINPLIALEKGCKAVDARIIIAR